MSLSYQADAHHPLADKILSPDNVSKDLRQWGFDIFGLDTQELGMLAATVLADTGLPRVFGINMKVRAVRISGNHVLYRASSLGADSFSLRKTWNGIQVLGSFLSVYILNFLHRKHLRRRSRKK